MRTGGGEARCDGELGIESGFVDLNLMLVGKRWRTGVGRAGGI